MPPAEDLTSIPSADTLDASTKVETPPVTQPSTADSLRRAFRRV